MLFQKCVRVCVIEIVFLFRVGKKRKKRKKRKWKKEKDTTELGFFFKLK